MWQPIIFFVLLGCGTVADAAQLCQYNVTLLPSTPQHILIDIMFEPALQMQLPTTTATTPLQFVIPRAVPSGYTTHYYDLYVFDLHGMSSASSSSDVNFTKADLDMGPVWSVTGSADLSQLSYKVDIEAMEVGITSCVDTNKYRAPTTEHPGYVLLLGYATFGFIDGITCDVTQLHIQSSSSSLSSSSSSSSSSWSAYSTLLPSPTGSPDLSIPRVRDFYALADSQIIFSTDIPSLVWHSSMMAANAAPESEQQGFAPSQHHSNNNNNSRDDERDHAAPTGSSVEVYMVFFSELSNVNRSAYWPFTTTAVQGVFDYFTFLPPPLVQQPSYSVLFEYVVPRGQPASQVSTGMGMEHEMSCSLNLAADTLIFSNSSAPATDNLLWRLQYFVSHHATHMYIPKQCYGEGYRPFQWQLNEVMPSIWLHEGVAQYIAAKAMVEHSKTSTATTTTILPTIATPPELENPQYPPSSWLQKELQMRFVSSLVENPPLLHTMTLPHVSLVASTQYATDFRTGEEVFSRGALFAYCMDLYITAKSEHTLSQPIQVLVQRAIEQQRPVDVQDLIDVVQFSTHVDVTNITRVWMEQPWKLVNELSLVCGEG